MHHKSYEDYRLLFTLSIKDNLDGLKNSYWKINSIRINQYISTISEVEEFYKPKFELKDIVDELPLQDIEHLYISTILNAEGIEKFTNIESLSIVNEDINFAKIKKAIGKEKTFFLVDLLWYPKLTQLKIFRLENIVNLENSNIKQLDVGTNHIIKKLLTAKFPETLESLVLTHLLKLRDFSFIHSIKNLRKLSFNGMRNLVDISFVNTTKIEEIYTFNSVKIDFSTLKSDKIKLLDIHTNVEGKYNYIESLDFIKKLPNLEYILLVGRVKDKDLKPLVEHPSLKTIEICDRRGYNYKIDEIFKLRKLKGLPST